MAQMLDAGVQPTARVLETMVLVSLGQFNYEDAFVYLESMKAHSMVPAWRTYAAVVRRCARVRDPRAQTALREMQALGYPVTDALRSFVALHGRSARYTPAAPRKADREAAEPTAVTQQPDGHAPGAPSFKI
ncbi:hypothetical protein BX661DRAFT_181018 [Kickxella alabastrina]|uniref:uncharacterized protein n=1 Tax=Kickxella alabastrina TaxID=61397 RepID=UPI002220B912|nr:uncharacterized protein BX661DRAFT_181018 [Kickxella alabastrina]KAI7830064.1 hypothetical protein BX661DRAFT_181018 [Kickxella alabastrina]